MRKRRASVLDFLGKELAPFCARLGTEDRAKCEAHQESIRALEKRLASNAGGGSACAPTMPARGTDFFARVKAFSDLVAMALRCDVTRVVSMTWGANGGGSTSTFAPIGVPGDYHFAIARGGPAQYPAKSKIDAWYIQNVAGSPNSSTRRARVRAPRSTTRSCASARTLRAPGHEVLPCRPMPMRRAFTRGESRGGIREQRLLPYLVLAIAAAATAAAVLGFRSTSAQGDWRRFDHAVKGARDRITARLETYTALLMATRGLFAAHGQVAPDEFSRFVEQLALERRYPGIQGIGYSRRFAAAERGQIEQQRRASGVPEFRVWPLDDRAEMSSIVYLEPLDRRNRAALGYDMATEAVRREAMERARDTGLPAASGRVTLVQEIDREKQPGFLIYVPLYRGGGIPDTVEERRAALLGFVYAPFRMGDLLRGIFGTEAAPRVSFSIYDGDATTPAALLYRTPERNDHAAHRQQERLHVAGRAWTVAFESLPALERGSVRAWWPYVAGGGLLVSALLFLLSRVQARTAAQLRLHARILESMTEGVSVSDEAGIIRYTNPAEDVMFGYAPGELIGKHVTVQNVYPPEENQRIVERVIARLREKGAWTGEFENVRKDGTRFVTAARITALAMAGRTYWVCVQEDVTERKRAEQQRGELLANETALRAAAESANRAKDEFFAVLGHELRNPLAPIATALALLERRGGTLPKEYAVIERQVRHLRRLVDDLLDVSRITGGKVALVRKRIELASPVALAVEVVSPLFEQRRHLLTVDVPPSGLAVDADEQRLAQVIGNLLTNAAKYTDPGGRIDVIASATDGEVVLRIRDSGIGIPPETIPKLFELFAQGDRGLDRAQGGLGIGLAIVRNLVDLHGGRVEAHSDGPGKGSEFVVRLPRASGAVVTEAAQTGRRARGDVVVSRRRRILVVDDNRDAADLLGEALRSAGHDVAVAYDAPQAMDLAARTQPEVAILDIGLPVMDGYELAARLTVQPRPSLIALTGYGQPHDHARSAEAGFEHHFVKPVAPERLLATIESLRTAGETQPQGSPS